jgi:hypothetical protein
MEGWIFCLSSLVSSPFHSSYVLFCSVLSNHTLLSAGSHEAPPEMTFHTQTHSTPNAPCTNTSTIRKKKGGISSQNTYQPTSSMLIIATAAKRYPKLIPSKAIKPTIPSQMSKHASRTVPRTHSKSPQAPSIRLAVIFVVVRHPIPSSIASNYEFLVQVIKLSSQT